MKSPILTKKGKVSNVFDMNQSRSMLHNSKLSAAFFFFTSYVARIMFIISYYPFSVSAT